MTPKEVRDGHCESGSSRAAGTGQAAVGFQTGCGPADRRGGLFVQDGGLGARRSRGLLPIPESAPSQSIGCRVELPSRVTFNLQFDPPTFRVSQPLSRRRTPRQSSR